MAKLLVKYLDPATGKYENATVAEIGDLTKLKTSVKTDLVAAINSIQGGGSGSGTGQPIPSDIQDQLNDINSAIDGFKDGTDPDFKTAIENAMTPVKKDLKDELDKTNQSVAKQALDITDVKKRIVDVQKNIEDDYNKKVGEIKGDLDSATSILTTASEDLTKVKERLTKAELGQGTISTTVDNLRLEVIDKIDKTDFDPVNQKVQSLETTVKQNADSIKIAATKDELSLLDGKVASNKTQIELNTVGMQSKVSHTEMQAAINKLNEFGRNFLRGTRNWSGAKATDPLNAVVTTDEFKETKIAKIIDQKDYLEFTIDGLQQGETYTASIFVSTEVDDAATGLDFVYEGTKYKMAFTAADDEITTTMKKFWVNFVASADEAKVSFRFNHLDVNNDGYLASPQIEKGLAAGVWSPHVEDDYATLVSINTEITQQADRIAQTAQKVEQFEDGLVEANSRIDQTTETIDLQVERIELVENITSDHEARLILTDDAIKTKVSQTEVDDSIKSINLDAKNKVLNSDFSRDFEDWAEIDKAFSITEVDGIKYATISRTGLTAESTASLSSTKFPVKKGQRIIFSFDMIIDKLSDYDVKKPIILEFFDINDIRVFFKQFDFADLVGDVVEGQPFRLSGFYTSDRDDAVKGRIRLTLNKNGSVKYTQISVRQGDVSSTDWMPAPEDEKKIRAKMETTITQTTKEIALKANQTDLDLNTKETESLSAELKVQTGRIDAVVDSVSDNETKISEFEQTVDGFKQTVSQVQGQVDSTGFFTAYSNDPKGEKDFSTEKPRENLFLKSYMRPVDFLVKEETGVRIKNGTWAGELILSNQFIKMLKPGRIYSSRYIFELLTLEPNSTAYSQDSHGTLLLYSGVKGFPNISLGGDGQGNSADANNWVVGTKKVRTATFATPLNLHDPTANYRILYYTRRSMKADGTPLIEEGRFSEVKFEEAENLFSIDDWNKKPALSANSVPYMNIQAKPKTNYKLITNIPPIASGSTNVFVFKDGELPSTGVNGVGPTASKVITTSETGNIKVAMRDYTLDDGQYFINLYETNTKPTIYTSPPSEDLENSYPKYIGYSQKSSKDPKDYTWQVFSDRVGAGLDKAVNDVEDVQMKYSQMEQTVDGFKTTVAEVQNDTKDLVNKFPDPNFKLQAVPIKEADVTASFLTPNILTVANTGTTTRRVYWMAGLEPGKYYSVSIKGYADANCTCEIGVGAGENFKANFTKTDQWLVGVFKLTNNNTSFSIYVPAGRTITLSDIRIYENSTGITSERVSSIEQTANSVKTTVANKADKTEITQLSDKIVIDIKTAKNEATTAATTSAKTYSDQVKQEAIASSNSHTDAQLAKVSIFRAYANDDKGYYFTKIKPFINFIRKDGTGYPGLYVDDQVRNDSTTGMSKAIKSYGVTIKSTTLKTGIYTLGTALEASAKAPRAQGFLKDVPNNSDITFFADALLKIGTGLKISLWKWTATGRTLVTESEIDAVGVQDRIVLKTKLTSDVLNYEITITPTNTVVGFEADITYISFGAGLNTVGYYTAPEDDLANSLPKFVGFAPKDSSDAKDFVWQTNSDLVEANLGVNAATTDILKDIIVSDNAIVNSNPYFTDWSPGSNYPSGYPAAVVGEGTVGVFYGRVTSELGTGSSLRYVVPTNVTVYLNSSVVSNKPFYEYLTVEITFKLVSGKLGGAGAMIKYMGNANATLLSSTNIPLNSLVSDTEVVLNKWYTVTKTIKNSVSTAFSGYQSFMFAGHPNMGTIASKELIVDTFKVRKATNAEEQAYDADQLAADMSNDSKITPVEKIHLKKEWAMLASEKAEYDKYADDYGVTTEKAAYGVAWQALNTALNDASKGILTKMGETTTFSSTTNPTTSTAFRALYENLSDTKVALMNAVNSKIKKLADDAKTLAVAKSNVIYTVADSQKVGNQTNTTLFIDTANGNTPRRWDATSKTWKEISDDQISTAAASAASAQAAATKAEQAAKDAAGIAGDKGKVIYTTADSLKAENQTEYTLFIDVTNKNMPKRWDATTKAWVATQDGAIATASTNASNAKTAADAASANVVTLTKLVSEVDASIINGNPLFYNWASAVLPTAYSSFAKGTGVQTAALSKVASENNMGFAVKATIPAPPASPNGTNAAVYLNGSQVNTSGFYPYLTTEVTFKLESGDLEGAGILVRYNKTGGILLDVPIDLKKLVPNPVLNKWYTVTQTTKQLTSTDFVGYTIFPMFNYPSFTTKFPAKVMQMDTLKVRPATEQEINAFEAKISIADMSDDNKVAPIEKVQLKKEWAVITAEKPQYDSLATSLGITAEKTAYGTAYTTLSTDVTNILASMTTTTMITGATFRGKFDDYYDKKAQLIKAINLKNKSLADTANTAVGKIKYSLAWANSFDGTEDFTTVRPNDNLISMGNISIWEKSTYDATTKKWTVNGATQGGVSVYIDDVDDDKNDFWLSFKIKKLAGSEAINVIGGHSEVVTITDCYIDGVLQTGYTWGNNPPKYPNDTNEHTISIRIRFKPNFTGITERGFYIQPNRNQYGPLVKCEIREIKLEMGSLTPYMPSISDDPTESKMRYKGYAVKYSTNPKDYSWYENTEYTDAIIRTQLGDKVDDEVFYETINNKVDLDDFVEVKDLANSVKKTFEEFQTNYDSDLAALERRSEGLVTNLEDQLATFNFLKTHIRMGEEGLEIGEKGSPMKVLITNDRMDFYDGGKVTATFSNQQFLINRGAIVDTLQIGSHKFTKVDNDSTIIQFVGQPTD